MSENMKDKLSAREVDVMRHALGLSRGDVEYRNYFAASFDSQDDQTWALLCDRGLAVMRAKSAIDKHLNVYHVTDAGRALLTSVTQQGE